MATKKYLDYDGLVELVGKIKEYIGDAGKLEFKGTVATVSGLPTVAEQKVGWMYTIQQEGETTSDFTDGSGLRIAPNSEVAAVSVDVSGTPTMKWCLLGPVFDVSDKLTFGTTMPSNPADGDTFLYLGNTTYTYPAVADPDPAANPQEEGWYESDGEGGYVPTSDTEVDSGKTYYLKEEQYVKGVIYVYNLATTSWIAQSAGDTMVAITTGEIDALFA